jgi:hypothetical protein
MVDWYKVFVSGAAISTAKSLNDANQINRSVALRGARDAQRKTEVIESRRILQNIGSFIDNIDKEIGSDESKLVSLVFADVVLDRKGLTTNAFDDMVDIKYASEIKAKYLEKMQLLSGSVNENLVGDLGNNFISSNFNIEKLGFSPTITRPFLLDISQHFGHIYLTDQYSIEIVNEGGPSLNLYVKDYGISYPLKLAKTRSRWRRYQLFDQQDNLIGNFSKQNDNIHDFRIRDLYASRGMVISLSHDTPNSKWPSTISIQTQEGMVAAQNVVSIAATPSPRKPTKGDGYCTSEGCQRPVFRQTSYCYKHK